MNDQEYKDAKHAELIRVAKAKALGGFRALDTFTEERFTPADAGQAAAFEACRDFDKKKDNLYLFGPTGTGKSHLAAIAARKFLGDNFAKVATVTQMQIARSVRGAERAAREEEIIERLYSTPVLVVSDLGVAKDSEFSISVLYEVIDGRYQNRPGGLIVTSNLSIDQLATKIGDDRLSSRLAQMCKGKIFSVAGEDRRARA